MSLQRVETAARTLADATAALKREVLEAQKAGVPDAAIARAAGVSRGTIQIWTGKRKTTTSK